MTKKKLIAFLKGEMETCEDILKDLAHSKSATLKRALEMPREDWALHVNDQTLLGRLVQARLKGEDIDVPQWHCECLYDEEFDFSEYKHLGYNDGVLHTVSLLLTEMGEMELAGRAAAAIYVND